jgi:hypothetical protein
MADSVSHSANSSSPQPAFVSAESPIYVHFLGRREAALSLYLEEMPPLGTALWGEEGMSSRDQVLKAAKALVAALSKT